MTVCLLLAAGSSSRMNTPKMLLPFNGKNFLQHAIDEINDSNADGLVVITGCYHTLLEEILLSQKIDFVENKNWNEGMGSSIKTGMEYAMKNYPGASNAIILVCDQPYLSSSLINDLVATTRQAQKGIVASAYSNTLGTPVLFDKKYFEQLLLLNGQAGAKKILQQFSQDVTTVSFPGGATDIDTPADYVALK